MVGLLGSRDALLRLLEDNLAADIHVRGNRVTLRGNAADVAFAERTIHELLALQESGSVITPTRSAAPSACSPTRPAPSTRRRRCSG